MAELPQLRSDRRPAFPPPPAPLFGQPPSFGVAHDLELLKHGALPPRPPRPGRSRRRGREGARRQWPLSGVRRWWASRDRRPSDLVHRVLCRVGRHDMRGGHQMQLGSTFVHVERRCQWCGARPSL
jgi:hypothetical protein